MTELVYCIRGATVCQSHRISRRAHEAVLNRELAALTLSAPNARLTEAIVTGIWGRQRAIATAAACPCTWGERFVEARGDRADWTVRCRCGRAPQLLAEHKPRWAPAHWKPTPLSAFTSQAVLQGVSSRWVAKVGLGCDRVHAADACQGPHPLCYRDTADRRSIAGPQILADSYSIELDRVCEVTVLNDSGSRDVNVIWDTHQDDVGAQARPMTAFPIHLRVELFPVRTTAEFLDDLAAALPYAHRSTLRYEDAATLRAVCEAMWVRAGTPDISSEAQQWIRDEVRECVSISRERQNEHELLAWTDYRGTTVHG